MNNNESRLLDVRSPDEYNGIKKFAERAGHIPGAINFEWTQAIDKGRNLRFKPDEEITALLSPLGITPDKEIITHCQTHHRSAHTYILLRHLGFERVKGYPGSWSEWCSDPRRGVETGNGAADD